MNLLERVLTLLRANLNTVVEKADDPEKALRQLQLDMRNQLVQVKTQVATAIAEGHKLQKRSQERKAQADAWLRKAEQAVQQGNDDAARVALTHYNDINRQTQRYLQQMQEQNQLVNTMRNALRQLEAKIAEVETTLDLLATRKRNALIQQRVLEALNKTGSSGENGPNAQARDALLDAQARARALEELNRRSMETELEQLSTEQEIEQQLREIKTQTRNRSPQRHENHIQTSPLVAPEEPGKRRETTRARQSRTQAEPSTTKDIDLERLKKLLDMPQHQE
ncbi:MAG TPA: PspA/IM30 family protein [Ktedonobacteraceae bacterium]|nr:PspA/IM30 family protein [Ktedonobacteraceae bacterium]